VQTDPLAAGVGDRLWLTEHYWPDLGADPALARAARAQRVGPPVRWVASLLVPGQRTVFGLFAATAEADVVRALAEVDEAADRVDVVLHLPATDRRRAPHRRDHTP
jgi:hypothetical protein